jgi:hypothetical protein
MSEFCESCGYKTENPTWIEEKPFCPGCVNDGSAEYYIENHVEGKKEKDV